MGGACRERRERGGGGRELAVRDGGGGRELAEREEREVGGG